MPEFFDFGIFEIRNRGQFQEAWREGRKVMASLKLLPGSNVPSMQAFREVQSGNVVVVVSNLEYVYDIGI